LGRGILLEFINDEIEKIQECKIELEVKSHKEYEPKIF